MRQPTMSRRSASWIRTFHPSAEPAPQLLCFPHAGGAAGYFVPLSAALAPDIQVRAVQYPGRQDRIAEPCAVDLTVMADEVAALVAAQGWSRLHMFGHSMGALVAYETARRLEQTYGLRPVKLLVSGMRAPSVPQRALREDSDDALVEDLLQLRGTPPELLAEPELRDLLLTPLRADCRAVGAYRPQTATVSAPATCFLGADDPVLSKQDAFRWTDHTTAAFAMRTFPGGHFYLDGFPAEVADAVRAELLS